MKKHQQRGKAARREHRKRGAREHGHGLVGDAGESEARQVRSIGAMHVGAEPDAQTTAAFRLVLVCRGACGVWSSGCLARMHVVQAQTTMATKRGEHIS